jgi:hypothetical protein
MGEEVVAEMTPLPRSEMTVYKTGMTIEETIADNITMEQPSQEKYHSVTHRVSLGSELVKTNSESLNLALVRDECDVVTFDKNLDNEQHVEENGESSSNENDEENMQAPFDTILDVSVSIGGEVNVTPHVTTLLITFIKVLIKNQIHW